MTRRRRIGIWLVTLLSVFPALSSAQARSLATAEPAEIAAGKRLFDAQCAWCHGTDGVGGTGPSLQRPTLRHAKNDADLVTIVRNGIPGTEMPSFMVSLTDDMTWRTAAYVRSLGRIATEPGPGNAARGASVYETRGCHACHVIGGRGGVIGPDLTTIGALRGPAYLRQAIAEPEAAHPPGYLVVRAIRRSGGAVRGIRLDEDAFWIHLRDVTGALHVPPEEGSRAGRSRAQGNLDARICLDSFRIGVGRSRGVPDRPAR